MAFQKIKARQIFDCRGEPTLEVDIITDIGLLRSSVPSTVLVNPNQAREIRDENVAAYHGRSVFKAVDIINNVIAPQIITSKLEVCQQAAIDGLLIKLDGTKNKSKLGVNTILGVSVACCKAGAAKKGLPVYRYIAELAENNQLFIPVPSFNMISGGRYAGNNLPCQEFAILPIGNIFADAVKMVTEIYRVLEKKIIDAQEIQGPLPVSDEGAFVPDLKDDKAALTLLNASIIDAGGYDLAFKTKDSDPANYLGTEALRNRYLEYLSEFPAIVSIEDPFHQEDWESWLTIANQKIQVVKAMERNIANCLMLRMSQIGTVTEVINCAKMARINDWGYIVSASQGETEDNFVADMAVGLAAGQFKAGAPCRSERMAKYNQILRIEEELGKEAKYVGLKYRNPLAK
ncbi:hypothetical protein ACFW04_007936 [Cataglyphis niger]